MDKYEFNIKVDQIKKRVDEGDFRTAMKIADSIDWSRVRNINLLTLASSVYEENGEYDEAKDKLLLAFERAPVGKRLLYKLCELSVRSGDLEEAKDYYNEFVDVAPEDAGAHVLAYEILSKSGASYDRLISELSAYTAAEPDERWLYELARVYDEAGYGRECVAACDRIALLFGAGKYSEKAIKLKAKYEDLTRAQQELINEEEKPADRGPSPEELGDELAAIRYENEDEAFEEYLRAHDLDKPLSAPAQAEAAEGDKKASEETMVSPTAEEIISREVKKLSEEPVKGEAETNLEKTLVFDGETIARLRSIVIKGGEITSRDDKKAGAATEDGAKKTDAETARKNAMRQAAGIVAGRPAVSISLESAKPVPAPGLPREVIAPVVEAEKKAREEARPESAVSTEGAEAKEKKEQPEERPARPITAKAGEEKKKKTEAKADEVAETKAKTDAAEPEKTEVADLEKELPSDRKPAKRHHMIIEAEDAASGFEIAKDELKAIHKEFGLSNAALKTSAEKLNERGLTDAVLEKIRGKDFIIENAGSLSPAILDRIYRLLREDESGMIVVLIDVPEGLDRMEERKPEIFGLCDLVSDFDEEYEDEESDEPYDESGYEAEDDEDMSDDADAAYEDDDAEPYDEDDDDEEAEDYEPKEDAHARKKAEPNKPVSRGSGKKEAELHQNVSFRAPGSNDEEMEIDDFAQYCCQYASEIDCSITGKSMLALYERIELMEEDNIPLNKTNAVRLIEEAADRAEKPPIGKRIKGMFSSKYDKNGLLILKEEDFIY